MISLDIWNESCNVADDLYTNICIPSKTKDVNVKACNLVTRINEAKTLVKHISYDFECKFNSATCNSSQKWNNNKCQCECKKYFTCKKRYSRNPGTCVCESCRYLKRIVDNSLIVCDEVINATNILSTSVANAIPTNFTSTVPINSNDEKNMI